MTEIDELKKEIQELKNCVITLPGNITISPGENGIAMVSEAGLAVFNGDSIKDTVRILKAYLDGNPEDAYPYHADGTIKVDGHN